MGTVGSIADTGSAARRLSPTRSYSKQQGLCRDNGKENGNYRDYIGLRDLGCRYLYMVIHME